MRKATKLSRAEFARAIKLGHGRAILHIKEQGDNQVKDLICKALTKCNVYDYQIEGGRHYWLWQILCITKNIDYYAGYLFENLGNPKATKWDLRQQYLLAALFFNAGFCEFRELLFSQSNRAVSDPSLFGDYSRSLVDIAGLKGLGFAISLSEKDPEILDDWECYRVIDHAIELLSESEITEFLSESSQTTTNAKKYLEGYQEYCNNKVFEPNYTQERPNFEKILELIASGEADRSFLSLVNMHPQKN